MRERRRFIRVAVQFGARYAKAEGDIPSVPGELLGSIAEGEVRNISSGGVLLSTEQPIPMGTVVQLEVTEPNPGEAIRAWGEVVWVADDDIGIEIVSIADRDQEKIDRIVAARAEPVAEGLAEPGAQS